MTTIETILLVLIVLFIILEFWVCFSLSKYGDRCLKPKYRIVNDMVEYFWREGQLWMPVTYWDENETERTMVVYDTVHGRKHIIDYVGPGRKQYSSIEELTFKNSKEIYEHESELISRENDFLVNHGKLKFVKY